MSEQITHVLVLKKKIHGGDFDGIFKWAEELQ